MACFRDQLEIVKVRGWGVGGGGLTFPSYKCTNCCGLTSPSKRDSFGVGLVCRVLSDLFSEHSDVYSPNSEWLTIKCKEPLSPDFSWHFNRLLMGESSLHEHVFISKHDQLIYDGPLCASSPPLCVQARWPWELLGRGHSVGLFSCFAWWACAAGEGLLATKAREARRVRAGERPRGLIKAAGHLSGCPFSLNLRFPRHPISLAPLRGTAWLYLSIATPSLSLSLRMVFNAQPGFYISWTTLPYVLTAVQTHRTWVWNMHATFSVLTLCSTAQFQVSSAFVHASVICAFKLNICVSSMILLFDDAFMSAWFLFICTLPMHFAH